MIYTVNYYCYNCYYAAKVHIKRGMEAPLYFECPQCGLAQGQFKKTDKNRKPAQEYQTKDGLRLELVR